MKNRARAQGDAAATTPGTYTYFCDLARFELVVPPRLSPRLLISLKCLLIEMLPAATKLSAE